MSAAATVPCAPPVLMYTEVLVPLLRAGARAARRARASHSRRSTSRRSPSSATEMIRRSGRRTVPQIFIGERHVGGSDDLHALDAAGGLDPLLQRGYALAIPPIQGSPQA